MALPRAPDPHLDGEDDAPQDTGEVFAGLAAHRSALTAYLRRRLRRTDEVEDYVQEVYARVLAVASPEKIVSPRGFLLRAASSLIVDQFRRDRTRQRDRHVSLEESHHPSDEGVLSPERRLAGRQRLAALSGALKACNPIERSLILMVRVEGLTHRDAAERLGLEPKAASRMIERILVRLARAVAESDLDD